MRPSPRRIRWSADHPRRVTPRRAATTALLATMLAGRAVGAAPAVPLEVKVIHAHNKSNAVDPRVAALVKDLAALKFTSYELKDQSIMRLEPGAVGRMRLPSGAWLALTRLDFVDDKLRLELEVKEIKFKTTVAIARGATLAVGGPPYQEGALILAITRRPDEP